MRKQLKRITKDLLCLVNKECLFLSFGHTHLHRHMELVTFVVFVKYMSRSTGKLESSDAKTITF